MESQPGCIKPGAGSSKRGTRGPSSSRSRQLVSPCGSGNVAVPEASRLGGGESRVTGSNSRPRLATGHFGFLGLETCIFSKLLRRFFPTEEAAGRMWTCDCLQKVPPRLPPAF